MYRFRTEPGSNLAIKSYYGEESIISEVDNSNSLVNTAKIGNFDIPTTTDLLKWGRIIMHKNNTVTIEKTKSIWIKI